MWRLHWIVSAKCSRGSKTAVESESPRLPRSRYWYFGHGKLGSGRNDEFQAAQHRIGTWQPHTAVLQCRRRPTRSRAGFFDAVRENAGTGKLFRIPRSIEVGSILRDGCRWRRSPVVGSCSAWYGPVHARSIRGSDGAGSSDQTGIARRRRSEASPSTQVSTALGITRQAVDKRRLRRALLAVPNGSGDYVYPACQFTADGVIPGLEDVLRAFRIRSPWTQLSALLAPAPALGGKSILETLKSGAVERAGAVAASLGEQAA